jgi:hypothetical protein
MRSLLICTSLVYVCRSSGLQHVSVLDVADLTVVVSFLLPYTVPLDQHLPSPPNTGPVLVVMILFVANGITPKDDTGTAFARSPPSSADCNTNIVSLIESCGLWNGSLQYLNARRIQYISRKFFSRFDTIDYAMHGYSIDAMVVFINLKITYTIHVLPFGCASIIPSTKTSRPPIT